jgi:methionine-rich copper-binding protein CopC
MNNFKRLVWIIVMLGMVTLACNMPWQAVNGEEQEKATAVAETVAAELTARPVTETAAATLQATAGNTATAEPTQTPPATATNVSTSTLPPTATTIPCNRASFVTDVTYPDGSEVEVNKGFVKTWRLQNSGSCTWTSGYRLVFSHGDRMNAPDEVVLTGGTVAPGQSVDVSVNLTAPNTAGTYKGEFRLKSSDGQVFGIGASGNSTFYVEIKAVPAGGIVIPPLLLITPLVLIQAKADVSYSGQKNCAFPAPSGYYLKFKIENTGGINLSSYHLTLKNNTAGTTTTNSGNVFGGSSDCISLAVAEITPGGTAYISSTKFDSQLIGQSLTATIKVCGLDDLGGFCTEKTISFIQ